MLRLALILAVATTNARALEVECEPAHPFFCMNIHAGCAGWTDMPTFRFKLKADGERGRIESESEYGEVRAEWIGDGETRAIFWPSGRQGYIRLMADGRYSFRHYKGDTGIMSYGECR